MPILLFTPGDLPPVSNEPIDAVAYGTTEIGCWSLGFEPHKTRTILLNADFSVSGAVKIDIRELIAMNKIDAVRSIYIYNDSGFAIDGLINTNLQRFRFADNYFGFMPILTATTETINLTADIGAGIVKVILCNAVMPPQLNEII